MPQELAVTIYRLLQEALQFLERHGSALSPFVELRVSEQGYDLDLIDTCTALTDATQLLSNMQARADLFGGRLRLTSSPGGGKCLRSGCVCHCRRWERWPREPSHPTSAGR